MTGWSKGPDDDRVSRNPLAYLEYEVRGTDTDSTCQEKAMGSKKRDDRRRFPHHLLRLFGHRLSGQLMLCTRTKGRGFSGRVLTERTLLTRGKLGDGALRAREI